MDSNETQMLLGLINSNARLLRLLQNHCKDLKNNGESVNNNNSNNNKFTIGDLEFPVDNLIRSFRRLEGVFLAVHNKENGDLQSFLQQPNNKENEGKRRLNSINILEKLAHFLHDWSVELERLKGEIEDLRASKRRRICRNNNNVNNGVEGAENVKMQHVESMILKKILSTLGW